MVVGKRSNQPRWPNRMAKGSRQLGRAPRWRSHEINCRSGFRSSLQCALALLVGRLGNRLEVLVLQGRGAGRSMQVRSLSKTNGERFVGSWDPLDGGV